MGKGRGWRQFFKPSVAKHWGPKPARLHRASRACLRFVAAEACAPGLCLRSVPSVPDFCFCWRRAKSIQCMALAAISHGSAHGLLAPEMLARRKDWVKHGCSFYVWFLSVFCNRLALVSLWGPASTSCHKDVLPKERVHNPTFKWHNANYSSKPELFRDDNPTHTGLKENCVKLQ